METARYEFKQGFLRLDGQRSYDKALQDQILKTLCGMANMGPLSAGYLYIGVADTERDAKRAALLDGIPLVLETVDADLWPEEISRLKSFCR